MPQFMKALHGLVLGRCQETSLMKEMIGLLPPNYLDNGNKDTTGVASPNPPIKEEPRTGEQSTISQRAEKCGWGPNCPFYKNQEEDWDGNHQKQLQQKSRKLRSPKQGAPRVSITKDPKTHRSPTKRHKLTNIQVRQNSTSNGKDRWKRLMLSTI